MQRMELTQSRIEPLETQAQLALAQHADKIAFAGLRGEESISALCCREEITESLY